MATNGENETFVSVKARLDEIVHEVGNESLSLDEVLSLYEEAVALGLRASDLLEDHLVEADAEPQEENHATQAMSSASELSRPHNSQVSETAESESSTPSV